jgi:hypothetical protein
MKVARFVGVCFFMVATGVITSATPAAATELGNKTVVSNTDFASFGVGGMRGTGTGTIAVAGVSGTVTKALLYWNGPTNGGSSVNATVSFAGNSISGTNIGTSSDNCWSFTNSQSYRADVTSYVSGNGSYALSNFRKTGPPVAEINGASLIVFFNDGNGANNRDVTIVDGNDSNVTNPNDTNGWNSTISGVQYASGTANLQLHVSDGQSYPDDAVQINGQPFLPQDNNFEGDTVPGPDYGPDDPVTGNLWDIKNYDISSFLNPGSNDLQLTSPYLDDCLSLVAALVDVPSSTSADLSVTKTDTDPGYGPDPVSRGEVVAYKVSVTNNGPNTATGITVNDSVGETGGTIVGASGTHWSCTFTSSAATCTRTSGFDSLANGATAEPITIQVQAPTTATPATIDDTATVSGNESDPNPDNNTANESTTVRPAGTADHASGFCSGATTCTISTDPGTGATKTDPTVSTITIPADATADPQTITMNEFTSTPTFCGGMPCQGQVLMFTSSPGPTFAGVTDPNHPAVVTMIFDKTVKQGTQIYVDKGSGPKLVKNCTTTGVASPHPCVSEKNILLPTGDREFKILFLVGDPTIGKH